MTNVARRAGRSGDLKRELPFNVYRVDASGRVALVIDQDALGRPSGEWTVTPL